MADELAQLEGELAEVELLIAQARTEATRHESRRAAAAEKITTSTAAATSAGATLDPTTAADLNAQLVLLTKRSALMESQVDVLEGKRRALGRYRDALALYVEALGAFGDVPLASRPAKGTAAAAARALPDPNGVPPAVSRLLLGAQEDLRREIARAMHDGPAQSLTNIVLQAQIVERLVTTDPARAGDEVRQLVAMVQQTLEATKSFIFDVRPMVLDDLGLVPTLRRAARERGRRAGVAGRVRLDGPGPPAADGPRERPLPDPRRGDGRLSRRPRRTRARSVSTGPTRSRRVSPPRATRSRPRSTRCPRRVRTLTCHRPSPR